MDNLIKYVKKSTQNKYLRSTDLHKIVLAANGLVLTVYDNANLVGFTLSGNIQGKEIYIVHDTDNYSRNNPSYEHLYKEVSMDTEHVVDLFVNDKIFTKDIIKKTLLKSKKEVQVIIPDKTGENIAYDRVTVNTDTFR